MRWRLTILLSGLLALASCPGDESTDGDTAADDDAADDDYDGGDDTSADPSPCDGHESTIVCVGDLAVQCDKLGEIYSQQDCSQLNSHECIPDVGCAICVPGDRFCDGNSLFECWSDGHGFDLVEECDDEGGYTCEGGDCLSPCDVTADATHNTGCLFYAIDMEQAVNHDHAPFGVVISNVDETYYADISVEAFDGTSWIPVWITQVLPREAVELDLPQREVNGSALNEAGAYRIRSSVPIVVYQLNPTTGGWDSSDSSLLLPVDVWDHRYRIPGWRQDPEQQVYHATMNIVASVDGTVVSVTPSSRTSAGPGIPSGSPTQPVEVLLDEGDVLQLANAYEGDTLAGSLVETDPATPVGVFAGHECANVPGMPRCCCDHLEEQVFGLSAWGRSYPAARAPARTAPPEPVAWQIVAGDTEVALTFNAAPGISGLPESTTLAAGEVLDLWVESNDPDNPGDFHVSGDTPFLLTQTTVSCHMLPAPSEYGDPAMLQMVSSEQFLDTYVVPVPSSWIEDFLVITRPTGASVKVDGLDLEDWPESVRIAPVGDAGFEALRVPVVDGVHVVTCSELIGVAIVGYDSFDSYAFPGGANLEPLVSR